MDDRRLSGSLLTGLMVLAVIPADGSYVKVTDVARRLRLKTNNVDRYALTLQAAGLLERDPAPHTRRYRRAL